MDPWGEVRYTLVPSETTTVDTLWGLYIYEYYVRNKYEIRRKDDFVVVLCVDFDH